MNYSEQVIIFLRIDLTSTVSLSNQIPYVKERLWDFFQNDVTMWIMPALAVSAFFYYKLNNPVLSVLPTDASISWWVLFAIRHYLTLHVSG